MNTPRILALAATTLAAAACSAQISLQSAVNLALKNSPKIRVAQAELTKAKAARAEVRDAFIPVITTQAGYGQSTGAPLSVPVVFSISAQSLVFSFSQRDYLRSAAQAEIAAQLALTSAQVDVVEDTTNTYLALDYGQERMRVLRQSLAVADDLLRVTTDRISLGVDAKVELPRSRRTSTQLKLYALQGEDEVAANREHLAQLTGLPAAAMITDRASVPDAKTLITQSNTDATDADSDGIRSAYAIARSKLYVAFGDKRHLLLPQVALGANYSRVATSLSSYAAYYPRYAGPPGGPPNSENALSFGLSFSVPLLDMAHRAKARASAAEAARAFASADDQRALYREGRAKLRNSARELDLRAQLARDDREIAQDQLETIQLQLEQAMSASAGSAQLTPKDRLNAQLQERQKYLDVIAAELQLRQTQTSLLRQTGTLGDWVLQGGSSVGVKPGSPVAPAATPLAPPVDTLPPAPSATPAR